MLYVYVKGESSAYIYKHINTGITASNKTAVICALTLRSNTFYYEVAHARCCASRN